MPEITLLHIGAATAAAIVGIVFGWLARGKRSAREKAAINAGWHEQLDAKNVESERLQSQNKSLMEQISQVQSADRRAARQARELSAALKEASERREKLKQQIEDLKGQLKQALDDCQRLESGMPLASNSPDIEARMAEAVREKDAKIAELNVSLSKWNQRLSPLVEKYRERDNEATALEAELAEARERIHALENSLDAISTAVDMDAAVPDRDDEEDGGARSADKVVNLRFADRNRPDDAAADDDKAPPPAEDSDLAAAGDSLDSQIVETTTADDDPGAEIGASTTDGGGTDDDEPETGDYAAFSDDDTGRVKPGRARTAIDPDGASRADDDEDDSAMIAGLADDEQPVDAAAAAKEPDDTASSVGGDEHATDETDGAAADGDDSVRGSSAFVALPDDDAPSDVVSGDTDQPEDPTVYAVTTAGRSEDTASAADNDSRFSHIPDGATAGIAASGDTGDDDDDPHTSDAVAASPEDGSPATPAEVADDPTVYAATTAAQSNDASAADNDSASPQESGDTIVEASGPVDDGAYDDYADETEGAGLRDNLKRINGIGPAIEKTLNELGIFRYRQIADMTDYDIDRVAKRLKGFRSRIYREDWMGQARELLDEAAGETA